MGNTSEPIEAPMEVVCTDEEKLLEDFSDLLSFNSNNDIQATLKGFLQKARKFSGVDILCIYHARADNLGFTKLASIEKEKPFPKTVNLDEITPNENISLWKKGDPAITRLQKFAQDLGLEYLFISRLSQNEGLSGIICAGGFQPTNLALISQRLVVISGLISSLLQKYIFEMYLKNQNEIISQKNETLDLIFQQTKDAVIIVDKYLRVIEINPTAEQIFGYSFKEIENRPVTDVLIGADGLIEALEIALVGIEIHELGIVSLHQRNGQAFSAHIRTLPIIHEKEKPQGILILISDESENEQNRIKVQHLEQRAALGSLASIFSHEVKNPISNIFLAIQLMQTWTTEDDRNYELVNRIYNDCCRLRDLTESILSFSRPIEHNLKPIDIAAQLSGILDRWRPRLERLNIQSNPLFPDTPLIIKGDPRMIDQIFTNLINNAVDAMEKTGGALSMKISKKADNYGKDQVVITVSDTGPGMTEEWLEKIFQPFKTTKSKGTGLGLALTKHMVTALHGTIQAESFNIGCVFTVRFPLYTENIH